MQKSLLIDQEITTVPTPDEYSQMVRRLFKFGDVLLPQLTETDVSLLHAAVGISTEAGELERSVIVQRLNVSKALETHTFLGGVDVDNIEEELGDHYFYDDALIVSAGLQPIKLADCAPPSFWPTDYHNLSHLELLCNLISAHSLLVGDVLDVVKKSVMYRKVLDTDKLLRLLRADRWVTESIGNIIGVSRDNILKKNRHKLELGPKARYGNGYTDQAAQQRVDKEGEE